MKKFALRAITLVLVVYGLLAFMLVVRCCRARELVARSVVTMPGSTVLFLGSSCVGCSMIETNDHGFAQIWQYRSTPQLSLVRLLELERKGELRKFKKVCLELGYQNFAYQTKQWMKDLFLQTLPMSWRYLDLADVSPIDLYVHFVHNCGARFELRSNNPFAWEDDVSVWSEEKKARDWEELKHAYFDVLNDEAEMIDDWLLSIERTIECVQTVCRRHKVDCEVVVFPISSYCRSRIPADAEKRLVRLLDWARRLGLRVRDYRAEMPDEYFLNLNHLSRRGASRFVEKLAVDD